MKNKFSKIYLFLAISALSSAFISCDNNDSDGGSSSSANKITATNVANSSDQIKTVRGTSSSETEESEDVIAEAPYSNNGFTLTLPATLDAKYLSTVNVDDMGSGFVISNPNAKIGSLNDLQAFDVADENIGSFYYGYSNETTYSGGSGFWLYVDSDVNITGTDSETAEGFTSELIMDMKLKKGWNLAYGTVQMDLANSKMTMKYSKSKPSGMTFTWSFEDYSGKTSSTPIQMLRSKLEMFK